jgi:O-antigen ligase
VSGLRKVAVAMVAAKVAVLTLVVDSRGWSSVDLPRVLGSRVLEWGLLACLVLLILRHGPAVLPRSRLHWVVVALVLGQGVSLINAQDRYVALYGATHRYLGVLWLLDCVVLYLAACTVLRTRRDVAVVVGAVLVGTAASVVTSVLQFLGPEDPLWLAAGGRASGLFGNPNMCAQFMGAVACACGAMVLNSTHRMQLRVAATLGLVLTVACLGLTGARGGVLGLAAGGLVAVFATLRVRGLPPGFRWKATVGLAAVLLLLWATPAGQRLANLQGALDDRLVIWEPVWREFLARPLLGFGPDGTGVGFPAFRTAAINARLAVSPDVDQAHNWVLQAAVTTGLVGVLALGAWVAGTAGLLWQGCKSRWESAATPLLAAFAAYWANALVTVDSVTVAWLPWLVAGAAVALKPPETHALVLGPIPRGATVLVWLVAAGGAVGTYGAFEANRAAQVAVAALRARSFQDAASAATAAIQADAGRAEYWNYRGLARGQLGELEAALLDVEMALRKAPHRAGYWGNVARVHADLAQRADGLAHREAALAAVRRGVALDPLNPAVHRTAAEVARALGDAGLALREAVQAIRLNPADGSCDALVDWAAAHLPAAEVTPLLEEGVALRPQSRVLSDAAGRARAPSQSL